MSGRVEKSTPRQASRSSNAPLATSHAAHFSCHLSRLICEFISSRLRAFPHRPRKMLSIDFYCTVNAPRSCWERSNASLAPLNRGDARLGVTAAVLVTVNWSPSGPCRSALGAYGMSLNLEILAPAGRLEIVRDLREVCVGLSITHPTWAALEIRFLS